MKKVVVVGGGIAGLVSSCQLAARGYEVILLEKQKKLGGKLQDVQLGEYRFDFGPSTITMPWIFERVFREAGKPVDPALRFIPLSVNSRNFFYNGTYIDLTADPDYLMEQFIQFSPENRNGFVQYIMEVQRMYEIAEDHFFENPIVDWLDFFSPKLALALMSVRPFQTMDAFHRRYFDDPRLIAMMNRYATYVGSSPYETPATLSLIGYLELVQGAYYIEGGNYRLIEAFERLAREVGVHIHTECPIDEIVVKENHVVGVRSGEQIWETDKVISNVDVRTTREKMLGDAKPIISRAPLSLSGFLCLFGVNKIYPHLHHHNFFYPEDYGREFIDIFEQKSWSLSPALYICNSRYSEPGRARNGSNLYVLINVPVMHEQQSLESTDQYTHYRDNLVYLLENQWGLTGLSNAIEIEKYYGPAEIQEMSGAWNGALYGPVSHGMRAFFRPPMKDRQIKGLYYTGGTTHPGGGTPMAAISGLTIAQIIQREQNSFISTGYK